MPRSSEPWDANIETADESYSETLSGVGSDGNRTYSPSGTYGQGDFTVRSRGNGLSDVYVQSDSSKGHSHDVVDSHGNIVARYHDYLIGVFSTEELSAIATMTKEKCHSYVKQALKK